MIRTKLAPSTYRFVPLLTVILVSRIVFAFAIWKVSGPSGFFSPDTNSYVVPAHSLLHGSFTSHGAPEIYRTPGYSLLLLPAIALRHLAIIGLIENFLLATASAFLVWKIANHFAPSTQAARWAVLLYCLEPVGLVYSEKLLPETAFSTLLLWFVWLLTRFFSEPRYTKLVLSGLALGCATYMRPAPVYLGLWLIPVFLMFPRTLPLSQRIARAAIFPLVFGLTLGPWIIRNATLAAYAGFTPAPDYILYFYSAAAVKAKAEHKKFSQVQEELGYGEWGYVNNVLYLQRHPEQRTWSQADIFRFEGAEARRTIFQDPRLYSLIHLKGCTIVILDPGVTDLLKTVRLYPEDGGLLSRVIDQGPFRATLWLIRNYPFTMVMLFLLGTQLIVYYILALAGLRRLPMHARVFFAWTALYFVLVSGGPAGLARYRVPIMPLICISAGVAVAYWTAKTAPQKDPSALRDASAEFSR